ncbi:MAG: hypothetical protein II863_02620, partial [Kiritimatiellae bacterium]|nr:hypothetical protein [Kiritimatiellia bacterium]
METKCALLLGAAIVATTCTYADGGPDASRAVEGRKVELAAFQGADKLLNRGWRFRTGDDAAWAAKDFDDTKWRWLDVPHAF